MRLTPAQAARLAHLASGASLPRSQISRSVLTALQRGHAVRLEKSGAGYLVRGIPERLADFAQTEWGIRDLESHAAAAPENRSRASMAEIAGDSKALPNNPLQGIFLRNLGNASLHGNALPSTPAGSSIFITPSELPFLEIESSTLVGVENPACFFEFEKCSAHFPELPRHFVLILRWCWGSAWQEWLNKWEDAFYYFPDYDPAGLNIFLHEVLDCQPQASLLIPSNLESLLRDRGSHKLFSTQEHLLTSAASHRHTNSVASLLRRMRRALEQEHLLY